ncbi:sulfatase family protein [Marinobacterium sp. YM272]|uniref:sulfatase family protein n=1 Tax=Marinobacterium sp. YM272 TaxID=3421654 RepID=UPI003D7F21BF
MKPNFLFIVTDQHRADYLGCAGHPVLKTPHIDSIAASGTMFDRFYVANPVCMPNRSAILTGRYSSISGIRHNGIPLPLEANTFVDVMRAGGYDTSLIGKSHLQCTLDGDPEIGANPAGQGPLSNARRRPEGRYDQELESTWEKKGEAAISLPYYGFSHVDLLSGHGDEAGAAHLIDQRKALGDPESLRGAENQMPHDYTCPQAIRTRIPEEQHSTAWVRDRAIDYLSDAKRQENPFFAFVSFPDPHHPFSPPGKYWEMYDPDDMQVPASFYQRSELPPPHLKWLREQGEFGKAAYGAAMVTERQAQEGIALTCGMISMIDDAVGEILDTLRSQGLSENTIVVFTADHGDFLGDHGMILKGPMHYQSTIRVPFIWSEPGRMGEGVQSRLSSSVDISRTILNRAGLQPYWGMQGQDLFDAQARDSLLVEDEGNRASLGFETPPRVRTLITDLYRMSIYQDQLWGELYDLKKDPGEITNLWDDPEYANIKADLQFRLLQEMTRACDSSPWPDAMA